MWFLGLLYYVNGVELNWKWNFLLGFNDKIFEICRECNKNEVFFKMK